MRAVVFSGPGQFSLEDVPDPIPGPRDVLVRVEAVGICGTDIHVLDGEFAPTVFPIIPGHETSGVVEVVGDEVTELASGDHVSVDPTLTCGECSFCSVGRGNLCENWNGAGVARTKWFDRRVHGDARRQCAPAACRGRPRIGGYDRAAVLRDPRLRPVAAADGGALP